ncbi:hypothetical protein [Rhodovulum sp. ES.010]|uniref:hypothetical protein n=1 Tax=Rhodovulum sp. ES.010 TaxID=1882821 RepID=UPI00158814E2|nr:hypothetical protein [Rhodovulum sp. ES.010]
MWARSMWPERATPGESVPHWRCRFLATPHEAEIAREIPRLLHRIDGSLRWPNVETIERYNGLPAYAGATPHD